ncbi:GNAT family N-acetyltransferase [Methyloversatilis sp.]|uniref:GNAT family N-acetyltransferase n=1 Tax=Methyloversatilis sp. TaxID=2569862 RepID=UPI002735880E|nr:GNAT family N-acetyltransferase [Methyloversatilis sp.]MDP2870008.1 GNAT family N-acetyltransferase [Methyloversatilis sp.]MDP3289565.1 GNAT family N-acetyltransferase [Methyloversatilis sp.]MDP3455398.1 GNAT family N-acetyltransferase [Methyloversatilis sp.]MDP3578535.1 GNAT family N-acetyltransferase [Methyloversatilis sp.]
MAVQIDFDLDADGFRRQFVRIPGSNLLQHDLYGRAMARVQGLQPRWGAIRDGNDELGVVQVLERHALSGLLGAVVLDRGPLWLPQADGAAHAGDFFRAFSRIWPRRIGRRRRIIAELPAGERSMALLRAAGCRALTDTPAAGYATFIVAADEPAACRQRLLPRWRHALDKAEDAIAAGRLVVHWPSARSRAAELLRRHLAQRQSLGYRGPTVAELQRLLIDYARADQLLIGEAHEAGSDEPCSMIALLCHGMTATYQIAWNSDAGRRLHANNALLWSALEQLRERGIAHLDLGGHDAQHSPLLRRYKAGLGGRELLLACMHD